MLSTRRSLIFLAAALSPSRLWAAPASPVAGGDGLLTAVFLAANPAQGRIDAQTGQVTGPAADLTTALARQLGVPHTLKGGDVLEEVKDGRADIGFLAIDPVRARDVDFSRPYALAHNTYVVASGSPIQAVEAADRAGVRIGVSLTDAGGYFLQRNLKHAELVGNPKGSDMAQARRMLESGAVDAYAANTQRLTDTFGGDDAFRVLAGSFHSVQQAIAVRKGEAERLGVINLFLDKARASGLIGDSIRKARLVGVAVAPAD